MKQKIKNIRKLVNDFTINIEEELKEIEDGKYLLPDTYPDQEEERGF